MPRTTNTTADAEAGSQLYASRIERVRRACRELDPAPSALLVTDPLDVGYLTGFLGGDSSILLPVAGSAKPWIISDGRYETELEPFAPLVRIVMRTGSFPDAVREILDAESTIAIQPEHLTIAEAKDYERVFRKKRVLIAPPVLREMRERKDASEVALIRKAVRVTEAALLAVLPTIEPGQKEIEVAARIEMEMKSRGASRPGFASIVASGATAALPHYRPERRSISKSKCLLIDWGAVVNGYNADMCRTFAFGKWPKQIAEIYDITLEAHEAAAAALAPGKTNREIDQVARDVIARAGYAEHFNHGLGHGFGMNNKENPRLNQLYESMTLEPGHVVTIEPGIYLPGVGGVRLEDDYVVTERGSKNLSSMPKSREWATL